MKLKSLQSVFVIAEIGQNHQGNIEVAKDMILEASRAGVDCVKFQKSCLEEKFTKKALARAYNSPNSFGSTYGEHKRFLEFSIEQLKELKDYAESCGLIFSSSAMDKVSFDELKQLDLQFIKIGSGDTNNIPFMRYIAQQNVPLIVSTGMQNESTVRKVVKIFEDANTDIALLHCVSSYPTQVEDTQLSHISRYRKLFSNIPIGYSGHEIGWECSCLAVLMGAKVLERHFTLDKNQKGSDHIVSLDPRDIASLVEKVRLIEKNVQLPVMPDDLLDVVTKLNLFENPQGFIGRACGPVGRKSIFPCELMCKHKLGKSLVYSRDLRKGQRLEELDLSVKVSEPNGIPAELFDDAVGKEVKRDVCYDDPVMESDIGQFETTHGDL
ncbi:CLUMA_CG019554, isoform A [Clunio marinus]|uniref:CLUMA_CG019554, isoform A n=1 Tax=Clunio marinus TaxID=568069 RepID=A0A1J1J3F4_9DIPT|nr:CLUMA_CG019554, isoform A [Clunio marinus]